MQCPAPLMSVDGTSILPAAQEWSELKLNNNKNKTFIASEETCQLYTAKLSYYLPSREKRKVRTKRSTFFPKRNFPHRHNRFFVQNNETQHVSFSFGRNSRNAFKFMVRKAISLYKKREMTDIEDEEASSLADRLHEQCSRKRSAKEDASSS